MKNYRYTLLFIFLTPFLLFNNQCAKTKDVELINDTNDTTTNNIDTVYYGFVLNEVLYDPPSGSAGDANGDGVRDPNDDEFVEFVNDTDSIIDLSGYKIYDATRLAAGTPNHEFPDSSLINPGQAVVVFGGGTPSGYFGGAKVFTASNQVLNLNNAGDMMTFTDSSGNMIIEFDVTPLSDNPNESYTRDPDLSGGFVQHNGVSGTLFSPGTKTDGTSF